jgi:hypothetical protein
VIAREHRLKPGGDHLLRCRALFQSRAGVNGLTGLPVASRRFARDQGFLSFHCHHLSSLGSRRPRPTECTAQRKA